MNDETTAGLMKRTREWLQSCVNAATRSGVPEEADLEAFILAHIDGEPARLAAAIAREREAVTLVSDGAVKWGHDDGREVLWCDVPARILMAVAAAREEQREACARRVDAVKCYGYGVEADEEGVRDQCAGEVRDTPLDATPLADELRTLRARVAELEQQWADENRVSAGFLRRAEKAEAQVAAAREACRAQSDRYGADSVRHSAADDVLRAMDAATTRHD